MTVWLNAYEIDDAVRAYATDPILGPAARTLANLASWTDSHSDGWAYWPKPGRAAAQLQEILSAARAERFRGSRDYVAPTAADVRKAYRPIKAFRTRQGADFTIIDV